MRSQVPHTVWRYISGQAAGEIWHWSHYTAHEAASLVADVVLRSSLKLVHFLKLQWHHISSVFQFDDYLSP